MRMIKVVLLLLFVCFAPIISAQDDNICPIIVESALEAADSACSETSRNQACYGNIQVEAELSDTSAVTFEAVGDIAELGDIQSLALSGYDEVSGDWGVAILRVQANLPDTLPGQNVTFVLFGDAEITNAATDEQNPMEAFYFSGGIGESSCTEAPNGLLVQTPEGVAEVSMNMNGIDVVLGSTAFISLDEDEETDQSTLVFSLLEGNATVSVDDTLVDLEAGTFTAVSLDEDLNADSAPTEPEAYDTTDFEFLPTTLLEEDIMIAGMSDSSSDGASDGEVSLEVTPGTWTFAYDDFSGCGMPEGMASQLSGFTMEVESIGFEEFFNQALTAGSANVQQDGMDFTITNTDDNVFAIVAEVEGISLNYTYTFIDSSTIEFEGIVNDGTCDLTLAGTITAND